MHGKEFVHVTRMSWYREGMQTRNSEEYEAVTDPEHYTEGTLHTIEAEGKILTKSVFTKQAHSQ